MDLLPAVVLGIIQGATEYIPVSSTAHLLIAPWLFGWASPSTAFDILVQLGTLGAVCIFLRKDLAQIVPSSFRCLLRGAPLAEEGARTGWMLVVATVPAVVFGLLFKSEVEAMMGSPSQVMWQLLVNGLMLAGAEALASRRRTAEGNARRLTFTSALLIGCGQALAILPSISRSGATIAVAMLLGLNRGEAARFSFLMSIPVMLGAGVLGVRDLVKDPELLAREGSALVVAFAVAAVVGFAVIAWLQAFLKSHSLYGFAIYCIIVAVIGLRVGIGAPAG